MKTFIFLILLPFLLSLSAWAKPTKPNVLFIAIDDLNDWVGFLDGHPQAVTPHMDALAKRGDDTDAGDDDALSLRCVRHKAKQAAGPSAAELPGKSNRP